MDASLSFGQSEENEPDTPLAYWVRRMSEVELPAVSATVAKIQQLSENDDSSIQALADVILQDAAMTAHVLRLTSSAYHVRGSRSNSITRALVILGFKEVRAICLSISVLDDLIKKNTQKPFVTELARAFHAAVQTEQLACSIGDRSPQEVFIAALLHDLGRMLFYCFGGDSCEELTDALQASKEPAHVVEKRVLGFELRELTQEMAKKWGLGDLLIKSLDDAEQSTNRIKSIHLGHRFVKAVESSWDSPESAAVIDEMSALTGLSVPALKPLLHSAAEKAKGIAQDFHAVDAAQEIRLVGDERPPVPEIAEEPFVSAEPDAAYQLQSLQNVSLKLESKPEVQEVIDLVLDGIFRGLGMDRAVFAILSPNRKYLSGTTGFGYHHTELVTQFKFPLDPESPNIFQWVIEGQQAVWVADQNAPEFSRLLTTTIRQVIGPEPFFVVPTIVTGKPIGIIFADRHASKRPLDANLFQGFKQFAVTTNISLQHLKMMDSGSRSRG